MVVGGDDGERVRRSRVEDVGQRARGGGGTERTREVNDLDVARRMINALPPEGSADLPPNEKVKELVLFSVSESYFKLREALGIQIQV